MMTDDEANRFGQNWVDGWNAHDLDRILGHYAGDVEFLSPRAVKLTGDGRVRGIAALRKYWEQGLAAQPNLHFELIRVLNGFDALTISYRNHRGQDAAETVEFDAHGKILRSYACYS